MDKIAKLHVGSASRGDPEPYGVSQLQGAFGILILGFVASGTVAVAETLLLRKKLPMATPRRGSFESA